MKAMVWTAYGAPDVLRLREVEKPTPEDNEVLIRIHAATVTLGDTEVRRMAFPIYFGLPLRILFGFTKPRREIFLGQEFSGEIEAVGKDVTRFAVGDQVFGAPGLDFGAYAEFISLPEDGVLATKPVNMSYEEAAAVPFGGPEALHFLREGNVHSGESVLINGAGGSIGTFAVQLAKEMGAEVSAVDSAEKLDMLHSIGSDHVVDYKREDFTKSGGTYDVILDVVGKASLSRSIAALNENGRYLLANPTLLKVIRAPFFTMTNSKRLYSGTSNKSTEDLNFLKELIEEGRIRTVVDRRYPLEEAAEAHRYVETGQKIGNVIITIGQT